MTLNRDNTHSWVRISHGSNKFVMDLNNDTEIPEDQVEDQALQLDAKDFVNRSKAKAKPQRKELLTLNQESFPWKEGIGLILNQGNILLPIMKYRRKYCTFFVIHNMCIEKKMERFISGE